MVMTTQRNTRPPSPAGRLVTPRSAPRVVRRSPPHTTPAPVRARLVTPRSRGQWATCGSGQSRLAPLPLGHSWVASRAAGPAGAGPLPPPRGGPHLVRSVPQPPRLIGASLAVTCAMSIGRTFTRHWPWVRGASSPWTTLPTSWDCATSRRTRSRSMVGHGASEAVGSRVPEHCCGGPRQPMAGARFLLGHWSPFREWSTPKRPRRAPG